MTASPPGWMRRACRSPGPTGSRAPRSWPGWSTSSFPRRSGSCGRLACTSCGPWSKVSTWTPWRAPRSRRMPFPTSGWTTSARSRPGCPRPSGAASGPRIASLWSRASSTSWRRRPGATRSSTVAHCSTGHRVPGRCSSSRRSVPDGGDRCRRAVGGNGGDAGSRCCTPSAAISPRSRTSSCRRRATCGSGGWCAPWIAARS